MVGIRFGGGRDELLTFMQCLGVITPPYLSTFLSTQKSTQNVEYFFEYFLENFFEDFFETFTMIKPTSELEGRLLETLLCDP